MSKPYTKRECERALELMAESYAKGLYQIEVLYNQSKGFQEQEKKTDFSKKSYQLITASLFKAREQLEAEK